MQWLQDTKLNFSFETKIIGWIEHGITILLMSIIFVAGYWLTHCLFKKIEKNISSEIKSIIFLFRKLAKVIIIIIGVISILGSLGADISALVTSLGLSGFALGFALKDSLANVLAGIIILLYRPFRIGSIIDIAGHQGRVTNIDLRYTSLKQEEKHFLIPNSVALNKTITIFDMP